MIFLRSPHRANNHLTFSPDGRLLASAGNAPGVSLWDLSAGGDEPRVLLPHVQGFQALTFSADGRALYAACWPRGLCRLDADTGRADFVPLRGWYGPRVAAVSPAGRAAGLFFRDGVLTLAVLDAGGGTGPVVWETPHDGYAEAMAFTPDGGRLAVAPAERSPAFVQFYDAGAGNLLGYVLTLGLRGGRLAFAPDGGRLAWLTGRGVAALDLAAGTTATHAVAGTHRLTDVAFHPSGALLAVVRNDGTARLLNAATLAERRAYDWKVGKLRSVAFSPDGTRAAAGAGGKAVVVWDLDA